MAKYQWGIFTHLSVGRLYPKWSKEAPADHVTMAWLTKVCNGIKQYRKVHAYFTQTVGKITVCITKKRIIKNSSVKYAGLKITLLNLQNSARELRTTQQL
jgi:hypothetical protein